MFYINATTFLGYLPAYDMPDPKYLVFYDLYAPMINLTVMPAAMMLPVWVVLAIVYLLTRLRKKKYDRIIFISSLGPIIAFLLWFMGILEWFMD